MQNPESQMSPAVRLWGILQDFWNLVTDVFVMYRDKDPDEESTKRSKHYFDLTEEEWEQAITNLIWFVLLAYLLLIVPLILYPIIIAGLVLHFRAFRRLITGKRHWEEDNN